MSNESERIRKEASHGLTFGDMPGGTEEYQRNLSQNSCSSGQGLNPESLRYGEIFEFLGCESRSVGNVNSACFVSERMSTQISSILLLSNLT